MEKKRCDVIVVGGGIIGSAICYYLTRAGVDTILLDRGGIGAGTSGSCDGFMFLQTKKPGLSLEIAMKSVEMYEGLSEELDYQVHYRQNGGLILIETEEQHQIMEGIAKKQAALGLDVEIIDIQDTLAREPKVSDKLLGAVYSPMDGHVNPMKVTTGYIEASRRLGARIYQDAEVVGVERSSSSVTVKTRDFEVQGQTLVNAAGVWAADIGRMLDLEIPVIPRRGQILVSEPLPPMFNHVMLCARYIAIKHNPDLVKGSTDPGLALGVGFGVEQTDNGNLLISNSRDFAGYDKTTTRAVLREISRYALRFIPCLKDLAILRAYAGLRPYTPDGLPVMGPVQGMENVIIAAGHEGDGIAQAPVTGKLIADHILGNTPDFSLDHFRLERFPDQAHGH